MKIASLSESKVFQTASKNGSKAVSKGMVVIAVPNSISYPRLGFIITKKIGNAVVRNRIKRRIRVITQEIMPQFAKFSYDYIIIGRNAAQGRDFIALKKDFLYCLHNTKTYEKQSHVK